MLAARAGLGLDLLLMQAYRASIVPTAAIVLASPQQHNKSRGGTVRRGRLVACVCLLGIFAAALVTSLDYSLTDALGPGPGFFPFWLGLIGAALSVAVLIQNARSRDFAAVNILPNQQAALQAGAVLVALVVAAALLEPLGFRLTMLIFIVGLLLALGARSPAAILLTALAGSFGVFHVFFYWLKVPLPIGALGL
jgi:putative tricarboxylic transport membrane protein